MTITNKDSLLLLLLRLLRVGRCGDGGFPTRPYMHNQCGNQITGSSYLVSALIVHMWTSGKSHVPTRANFLTVSSNPAGGTVWKKYAIKYLAILVQPPAHLYGQISPSIFVRGWPTEPGQHLITVRELIFVGTGDFPLVHICTISAETR